MDLATSEIHRRHDINKWSPKDYVSGALGRTLITSLYFSAENVIKMRNTFATAAELVVKYFCYYYYYYYY